VLCCLLAKVCGIRPKLVVRQVDQGEAASVLIYNLVNKKVLAGITANDIEDLNSENTLHLYEPGSSKNEIPVTGLNTITTVPPNSDRYDEYSKNGMVVFTRMPMFSLVELLHIGREMRGDPDNANYPENLQELYSDESIKWRYRKFGGSIRRVLPSFSEDDNKHQDEFEQAIFTANVGSVRKGMETTRELSHTSSYIVQWTAPKTLRNSSDIATTAYVSSEQFEPVKWQYNFRLLETGWASPEAEHRIKLQFAELSLDEMRQQLKGIYLKDRLEPLIASCFVIVAVRTFQEVRKLDRRLVGKPSIPIWPSILCIIRLTLNSQHAKHTTSRRMVVCICYKPPRELRRKAVQMQLRTVSFRIEYKKQTQDPLSIN
jgi:hypothetical protein